MDPHFRRIARALQSNWFGLPQLARPDWLYPVRGIERQSVVLPLDDRSHSPRLVHDLILSG